MKGTRRGGVRRSEDVARGGQEMIRMKVVRSLSSMKTWKFEKGGPCEKGETAAKSGCTPASGEGEKKEGGGDASTRKRDLLVKKMGNLDVKDIEKIIRHNPGPLEDLEPSDRVMRQAASVAYEKKAGGSAVEKLLDEIDPDEVPKEPSPGASELSPKDLKEAKKIKGRLGRAKRKIKSLEKSRKEMVGKWLKGRPQKEIDSYNKQVDLEVEHQKNLVDLFEKHLKKHY